MGSGSGYIRLHRLVVRRFQGDGFFLCRLKLDGQIMLERVAVLPSEPPGFTIVIQASDADFTEDRIRIDGETSAFENLTGQKGGSGM